jgi:hypothetical protein
MFVAIRNKLLRKLKSRIIGLFKLDKVISCIPKIVFMMIISLNICLILKA